MFLINERFII